MNEWIKRMRAINGEDWQQLKQAFKPKEIDHMMEPVRRERRAIQAKLLWEMYYAGELEKQHIRYHGDNGEIDQEMLLSHHNRFAVDD